VIQLFAFFFFFFFLLLQKFAFYTNISFHISQVYVGDDTLSVLEIWGAEYQENNALLINPEDEELFTKIAARENCPMRILGVVTGDGKVVVEDSAATGPEATPVDLPLELVLGKMPQKTFTDNRE